MKTEIEPALQTVWKNKLKGSYLKIYFINLSIRNILASLLFYFDLGKGGGRQESVLQSTQQHKQLPS